MLLPFLRGTIRAMRHPTRMTFSPKHALARSRSALGALVLVLALPASARAQTLGLGWNSCLYSPTPPVQAFACNTNTGTPFDLIVWMNAFTTMTEVVRSDTRMWFTSSAPALPSWWTIGPTGCRPGAITIETAAPLPASCSDPWLGQATISTSIASPSPCLASAMVLDLHATLPAGVTRTLDMGTRYAMFRLRIARALSTGAGACGGCSVAGSFGVGGLTVGNSQGLAWSVSPNAYAAWQNFVPNLPDPQSCGPTPARASTWGSIKSLYR